MSTATTTTVTTTATATTATAGSFWGTSTATTTTAGYYGSGIRYYIPQTTYTYIPTNREESRPPSDPEAIQRHELQQQRRAPLEKWRKLTRDRVRNRQKREETEASELAKRLLFEYLDENNRNNFTEKKPLEVESGIHPGVKYQIPYYENYEKIKAWRGDRVVSELCLQVRAPEWIPHEDKLLVKLLYLRSDEATALRTANHFNIKENLLERIEG